MLAGDLQFAALLDDLIEQSSILDGDHGLAGKILYEGDFLGTELMHLLVIDRDGADQLVVFEERHGVHGPVSGKFDGIDSK